MKKTICMLMVFSVTASSLLRAQSSFDKGTSVISLGVGLGSSILKYSGSSQTPAISVQYENGTFPISDIGVISLGGYAGFKRYSYDYGSGYKAKWTYTIIGGRSTFHLTKIKVPKLDLYGGVMVSYNYLTYKDATGYATGSYGSDAGATAYIGGRYYVAKHVGVMAELGYGVSYLTLGASLKL